MCVQLVELATLEQAVVGGRESLLFLFEKQYPTYRQTDIQTYRHTDIQTYKHTHTLTGIYTHKYIHKYAYVLTFIDR